MRTSLPTYSVGSTLLTPFQNVVVGGLTQWNAFNCGFSSNITYRLDDLAISIQQFRFQANLYSEYRVRRIHHKWWAPRIQKAAVSGYNDGNQSLIQWTADKAVNIPMNARGGDMVWMCTRKTGHVPELNFLTADLDNGTWLNRTGYSMLKRSPKLRKRCQFRNNVAYGMRPVKFKFRPTILAPDRRPLQATSLMGTTTSTQTAGLLNNPSPGEGGTAPFFSDTQWKYVKMPWLPTVLMAAQGNTYDGGPQNNAAAGNYLENSPANYPARLNRWHSMPMFGMYVGMQPQTTQSWPTNLRQSWSYELEFRKPRMYGPLSEFGDTPSGNPHFKEWGLIPSIYETSK